MDDGAGTHGEPTTATPSELYLNALCSRAFLSLWSVLRPHKSQQNRELCDLLVVFDRDIIIFSDKHCEFPDSGNIDLDWARWHRRAIGESWRQIRVAENWLRRFPNQVFRDRHCKEPLHYPVPVGDDVRYHRVVIVRGAADRCRSEMRSGSGSLIVSNYLMGKDGAEPFFLGIPEPGQQVVHIFDEVTVDIILQFLDTPADFIRYLRKREEVLLSGKAVLAAGEEELLAFYLTNLDEAGGHTFNFPEGYDMVGLEEGYWLDFLNSPQFAAWRKSNEVSYAWDKLTEKFIYHAVTRTQHYTTGETVAESEQILRWMAREPRVRRRMLAREVLRVVNTTPKDYRRTIAFLPSKPGDPYWLLLVLPHPEGMPYEDYREGRMAILVNYLYVVKMLRPEAEHICGLAFNSSVDGTMTEDSCYYHATEISAEVEAQARIMHEEHGFLKDVKWNAFTEWEFPLEDEGDGQKSASEQARDHGIDSLPKFRPWQGVNSRVW